MMFRFQFEKLILSLFIISLSCKENISIKNESESKKYESRDFSSTIDEDYVPNDVLNIEISDTLFLGGNLGKVINYKPQSEDSKNLLSVIISNEISEGVFVKDTFSDGTLSPQFVVFAYKEGLMDLEIKVLEETIDDSTWEKDSIITIHRRRFIFGRRFFVIDSIYGKPLNY